MYTFLFVEVDDYFSEIGFRVFSLIIYVTNVFKLFLYSIRVSCIQLPEIFSISVSKTFFILMMLPLALSPLVWLLFDIWILLKWESVSKQNKSKTVFQNPCLEIFLIKSQQLSTEQVPLIFTYFKGRNFSGKKVLRWTLYRSIFAFRENKFLWLNRVLYIFSGIPLMVFPNFILSEYEILN